MEANSREFYYYFPHVGLPSLFFEDGIRLYQMLNSEMPTIEIRQLWDTLARQLKANVKDLPQCFIEKISKDRELIIIEISNPIEAQEVKYVCLVYVVKRLIFKREITPLRYFTLELAEPVQRKTLYLCERINSTTHINYGEVKDNLRRTFIEAVQSVIDDNKIGSKTFDGKVNTNGEKQIQSNGGNDQEEVQQIDVNNVIDYWAAKVPEDLYNQAENTFSNFILQCSTLLEFIQATNRINKKKYDEMGNQIKKDLPSFANISLLLGVDFGARGICHSEKIHEINDLPVIVLWTLDKLREPFETLNFQLIDIASGHKPNAKEESKKALIHLFDGQTKSFRLGVTYAESINHNNPIDRTSIVQVVATHEEKPLENNNRRGEVIISDTIKDLLDVAYHDPDPSVRKQAQEGLRELHPGGPEGFDAMINELIEGLRDPNKKASSLELLTGHREMALPLLFDFLKDPDPEFRMLVLQLIVEIEKKKAKMLV